MLLSWLIFCSSSRSFSSWSAKELWMSTSPSRAARTWSATSCAFAFSVAFAANLCKLRAKRQHPAAVHLAPLPVGGPALLRRQPEHAQRLHRRHPGLALPRKLDALGNAIRIHL